MPEKIKDVQPPHGVSRVMYRLPIWLFHVHLGWLLGNRFLLLTHTGRKSGLARRNVLEVIQYERASCTYYVLAAWGEKSDWVRNVMKTPEVAIAAGHRHFDACAVRLSPDETEHVLLFYARRHPTAACVLPRLMGYRVDGTETDFLALMRRGIVFAFHPVASAQAHTNA
ncbi:MAG TPA: nitroreductase family deazaflavin-dependent oxidoreductase [Ktedonobacteraceae bacterium]|nr:nitroreductase family deazaflavin-dependent oxidoreductase [Ktedonobacteraceae bacterium]